MSAPSAVTVAACWMATVILFAPPSWAQAEGDQPAAPKAAPQRARPEAKEPSAPIYPLLPTVVYTREHPPATPKLEDLPLVESVSQYGITWTFDKPARVARFVNGDYYVVGEVTVKMIDPKPLWGDEVGPLIVKGQVWEDRYPGKTARNGSTLNPIANKRCGFDSRCPSNRYDPDQFTHLPIRMVPGDSLVSTVSRPNELIKGFAGDHVDPLRKAAVLTCLAAPQPPDAFRPSYVDTRNSKVYLARNLRRDLLLTLRRPKANNPRLAPPAELDAYARGVQKVWLDQADYGMAAPTENLPHYGQTMANLEGEASLLLLMDYTPQQKEPLLVGMVQIGIDFWGLARGGMVWQAHGGINSARKWPILLAGILLDDPDMKAPKKNLPDLRFQEDDQTAFAPVAYRGRTFQSSWTGAKVIFMGHSPHLMKEGEQEESHWNRGWGLLDVYHPKEWPLKKRGETRASEGYRRNNTSCSWVLTALAVRLMHAEKVWDHDAFFAYVDRWMTEDDTAAVEAIREAGFNDMTKARFGRPSRQGYISGPAWGKAMWATYRNNLPPAPDGHKDSRAEDTWRASPGG